MTVVSEKDELFDRAVHAAMRSNFNLPAFFGSSSIREINVEKDTDGKSAFMRYELSEMIGQGGIGVVFRARDRDLCRDVAVKVLRKEFEISRSAMERFLSEARIAGQLQHAGIPPVYEVGTFPDGRVYLVMKLIQGRNLSAILRAEPPSAKIIPQLLAYFASICQTVAFAHANGVIHCDLKPNNIMVGEFGEVHVMDWGLAKTKLAHDGQFKIGAITPFLASGQFAVETPQNEGAGTRGYMAPELFHHRDSEIDERCDVYSLGMMLFEMVTGKPCVSWQKEQDTDDEFPESAFDHFNSVIEHDSLRRLVRECLSPDRTRRPLNASEVARVLSDYQANLQIRMRDAELANHASQLRIIEWRRRFRLWLFFGIIITLMGIVIVGYRINQNKQEMERLIQQEKQDENLRLLVNQYLNEADTDLRNGRRLLAESSIRKAEGVATTTPEFLRRKVEERLKDLHMLKRCDSIRLMQSRINDMVIPNSNLRKNHAGLAFDRDAPSYYANAFREYGIDIEQTAFDDIVQSIRAKPIRNSLVRSLDEWAMNVPPSKERDRIRRIADSAEEPSNGLARRVRMAFDQERIDELVKIASEIDVHESPNILFAVGHALRKRGVLDSAEQILSKARSRYPGEFWLNLELGTVRALIDPKDPAQSKPWIETAFVLSEGNAEVYTYLGVAQADANLFSAAERSLREALVLNPKVSGGPVRLAFVLCAQKKYREACEIFENSIAAQPQNALARFNLAITLQLQKSDENEVLKVYRDAVAIDPLYYEAWNNLGNVLTGLRQYEEADSAFQSALNAKPNYTRAMFNQAVLNDLRDRFDRAIELYQNVLLIDPEYAEAEYNLAHDLVYQKGRFTEAIQHLENGYQYLPNTDPTRGKWQRLIDSSRKWDLTNQRLDQVITDKAEPATPLEATELAVMAAWPHRQQFHLAVQFFEFAFARNPAMANDQIQGYRYFAAGCSARAAAGLDRDTDSNETVKQKMRMKTRQWLEADLVMREKQLESKDPVVKRDAKAKLQYWLADPNFATIRDDKKLQSLPKEELAIWKDFWKHVRELQNR